MSSVYVVRDDGSSQPMTRVRCKNEDLELQRILERNPDLLPGDQIDPEDPRRWLLIQREMPVPDPNSGIGRWSVDFLFADQDAMPTFVECKRCTDTRARREIVGQMLEYAANGHYYWSKETLRDAATLTAGGAGSLESTLKRLKPNAETSVDEYFELLEQNLREGQLRVIFFLEDSSLELRSIVDFLNRQMERTEVLLVEARQYSQNGAKIVVPTLFGYTEQARLVKRTVTVKSATSGRRRWDRDSYFTDAAVKLSPEQVKVMEELFDSCRSDGWDVHWGTGLQNGSFNVKDPLICARSMFSCYSNGDLQFNLFWLNGSDRALHAQRRLRELVVERFGVPADSAERPITIDRWGPKASEVLRLVQEVRVDCRSLAGK